MTGFNSRQHVRAAANALIAVIGGLLLMLRRLVGFAVGPANQAAHSNFTGDKQHQAEGEAAYSFEP